MPTETETKSTIKDIIESFKINPCSQASVDLLNILGYQSNKIFLEENDSADYFLENTNSESKLKPERALVKDWKSIEILFQITDQEVKDALEQQSLFSAMPYKGTDINSFLFLSLCLCGETYTRTQLATITREINKLFMMPAIILFTYGNKISIGIIIRRIHKRDASKDVLEKVTLIKDIDIDNPHRAHIEILFDLSMPELRNRYSLNNFADLQNAWQETLDIEELNKKFYKEVANWYFWAIKNVTFPRSDNTVNEETLNAINVIRLITRLIFVWFIKEKHLVPDELFDEAKLKDILKFKEFDDDSIFYKAILQNLFFATLNQEMNEPGETSVRKFRSLNKNPKGLNGNRLITNLYRYERYFHNPEEALTLFEGIPFLNGGLFECLDKEVEKDGKNVVIRIDGFSDEKRNPVKVPYMLFFGDERDEDLNDVYNTRGKRYKVKGIIRILNSYKFTIEENTPIDEEVALDPELLGKVFENLLAAYNPETSTTARRATGSYYTPRPIVEYMVDEALIAYLINYLMDHGVSSGPTLKLFETRLKDLFRYTEIPHQFNENEARYIIQAIDEVNVIDPACGSGAFPMGILHKLVYILGKLDPENVIWQEIQFEKAIKGTEEAYQIGDRGERKQRIVDIEEAFDNNTSDYGRKLYLIESCLYGVDIQPIAVQITKLRFFISLIVDQNVDRSKPNLGIRPLPNLETKFVTANSLISLDKPLQPSLQVTSIIQELEKKQEELAIIRHKLFSARTQITKRKYREMDKNKRIEIKKLLVETGWKSNVASLLADWDPYDQNTSASFYEPEWMMGIIDGFDIVIANPPYVSVKEINAIDKRKYQKLFIAGKGRFNLFTLFLEKGDHLLRNKGIRIFILPEGLYSNVEYRHIRKQILESSSILFVVLFSERVFQAAVDTSIICTKKEQKKNHEFPIIRDLTERLIQIKQDDFLKTPVNIFLVNIDSHSKEIVNKLMNIEGECIESLLEIQQGIIYSGQSKEDVFSNKCINEKYKKVLDGRDILKWKINWENKVENRYIYYSNRLHRPRDERLFTAKEKLLLPRKSTRISGAYDNSQFYALNTAYVCLPKSRDYNIKFLLAIFNSKLINFYYSKVFFGWQITIPALNTIIIPNIENQFSFINAVDNILKLTNSKYYLHDASLQLKVLEIEKEIDLMIYDLYQLSNNEVAYIEDL